MWQRRLNLGTYFSIPVYVHWTFAILVCYVGYSGYQDGILAAAFSVFLLLSMFVCVTLHEYGHALTARRFGIGTLDITLFPIGGVARLLKIPRVPWQELLVAVAGPMVNVLILIVIGTLLLMVPALGLPSLERLLDDPAASEQIAVGLDSPSALGYLLSLMIVNLALILFNMIPAFPMDGGRVLRSLLAMVFEYRLATRIASIVGIFCAMGMFSLAIYFGHPTAALIAVFICYAGMAEARQVNAMEPLRNLTCGQAMIASPPTLSIDTYLGELNELMSTVSMAVVPVVGPMDVATGVLSMDDVAQAVRSGANNATTVGEIANHNVPVVSPNQLLESVVTGPGSGHKHFLVVDPQGQLLGLLDLDAIQNPVEIVT